MDIDIVDDRPLAVRRSRRSSIGVAAAKSSHRTLNISTPPSTPRRTRSRNPSAKTPSQTRSRTNKKRVRFSDPGPSIQNDELEEVSSTGLTPFVSRASLSYIATPRSSGKASLVKTKRRNSTPHNMKLWNLATDREQGTLAGTVQFEPIRQVLSGRVKRRIRRNNLSEEIERWNAEKRAEKREVTELKESVKRLSEELQAVRQEREASVQNDIESANQEDDQANKVRELEAEIEKMREQLSRKENAKEWALADRGSEMQDEDAFIMEDDDEMMRDYEIAADDDDDRTIPFDIMSSSPARPSHHARHASFSKGGYHLGLDAEETFEQSFPSPPSTVPNTPLIPQKIPVSSTSTSTQASLPDPEKTRLEEQLETLRSELATLASHLESTTTQHERLATKLNTFTNASTSFSSSSTSTIPSTSQSLDIALDEVLTALALSQSREASSSSTLKTLTTQITALHYPSSLSPDATLSLISSQFQSARIELERLMPGEQTLGLYDNSKLLDLLMKRLSVLVKTCKRQEEDIDEYHSIEQNLRSQFGTRIDVLRKVQSELQNSVKEANELRNELRVKEGDNERLRGALEKYRKEVQGMEGLIMRVESEHGEVEAQLRNELERAVAEGTRAVGREKEKHENTKYMLEGSQNLAVELEGRLNRLMGVLEPLKEECRELANAKESAMRELERNAKEMQDLQNRGEESEKEHGEALKLRDARVAELQEEVERVNAVLKSAHDSIVQLRRENEGLERRLSTSREESQLVVERMKGQIEEVLRSSMAFFTGDSNANGGTADAAEKRQSSLASGSLLDGRLARRKKRKYDSGLGFLEEESEGEGGDAMVEDEREPTATCTPADSMAMSFEMS